MIKQISSFDVFPLSVATGEAFCNRLVETEKLIKCINQCRPILLDSPRRYGKTSLALHAIQQTELPYAEIELFSAINEEDIERAIIKGLGKLISRMESIPTQALALASDVFDDSYINAILSNVGISIEFKRGREKPTHHVLAILERLERLAEKTDKKIILFFDDFQHISEITPKHAIESVLSQFAQLTESIAFIFSGGNQHSLHELFDHRNHSFYKLCERITLERIHKDDYTKHIQKVVLFTWETELSQRVLECIFNYSECHPYYVNLLCSRFLLAKHPPTPELIEKIWYQYALEERSSVASEVELLSKNQRKLLTILGRTNGADSLLSTEFIEQANMSKETIEQTIIFLENRDYVFKDNQGYIHVLDPLIKTVLSRLY